MPPPSVVIQNAGYIDDLGLNLAMFSERDALLTPQDRARGEMNALVCAFHAPPDEILKGIKMRECLKEKNRSNFPEHISYETLVNSHGAHVINSHETASGRQYDDDHTLCFHQRYNIVSILNEADRLDSESTMAPVCQEILEVFKGLSHKYRQHSADVLFDCAVYKVEIKYRDIELKKDTPWWLDLLCCMSCQ